MSGHFWKRLHLVLSIIWFTIGLLVLFVFTEVQKSVSFLVWVSIYANFVGHLSSWQASRVEERQEKEDART